MRFHYSVVKGVSDAKNINIPKKCIDIIQMAALDIWSGIDDFDVAKDRYLKFCALGDHIPFKEALSEVGIHNVFEEKCSIILAEQITEEFGFDYEDVKHDEWYYNAVFFSLPYVDGLSDVEYGINQNASRGIIATGIAGLCRGENVESKAKFTDIPANNKVYINWAYDNGIIYGYDDTLFGYSDDVTREEGVNQIRALLGLHDLVTNVNIPNYGQIPNLPIGAVVESNAVFRTNSVNPVFAGNIPSNIHHMIARICIEQKNVSDAIAERDLNKIFLAFANDPLVTCSIEDAKKLFIEMIQNTCKYLTDYDLSSLK